VGRKEWVPEAHFQKALQSQKFTKWVQGLNNEDVNIVSINVLLVYMFGNNVGFINVETEVYYENKRLPGFVFIRGDAVAILVLVNGKMILTR
jgi:ADP-sugar diphosphatase